MKRDLDRFSMYLYHLLQEEEENGWKSLSSLSEAFVRAWLDVA
jgi:hypothetical protein